MNNSPEIKQNSLIKLGDHTLICGDCAEQRELPKINSIITDPPYGVDYVEGKKSLQGQKWKGGKVKDINGDQLQTEETYANFTHKWLETAIPYLNDYNTVYIFNSDLMICALREGMKRAGFKYSQLIIWVKNTIVIGRMDYLLQHELLIYGWYGKHKFRRSKSKSVLFHAKPAKSKLHPTMKPLGLMRKIILNSTEVNDVVYDPFGGSGSTLIACEQTKRKCVTIEKDPAYCQVIIKRWEQLTNLKAKYEDNSN